MENASKALLMAAGVLIGVLILTLAVYLFATFGATSAELHKQQATNRLNEFNSQFTSYEEKNENGLTIYDFITVANLATENNNYYDLDYKNVNNSSILSGNQSDYYVSAFIEGKNPNYGYGKYTAAVTSNVVASKYQELITEELNKIETGVKNELPLYECTVSISPITQRVYKVEFKQKKD